MQHLHLEYLGPATVAHLGDKRPEMLSPGGLSYSGKVYPIVVAGVLAAEDEPRPRVVFGPEELELGLEVRIRFGSVDSDGVILVGRALSHVRLGTLVPGKRWGLNQASAPVAPRLAQEPPIAAVTNAHLAKVSPVLLGLHAIHPNQTHYHRYHHHRAHQSQLATHHRHLCYFAEICTYFRTAHHILRPRRQFLLSWGFPYRLLLRLTFSVSCTNSCCYGSFS